MDNIRNSFWGYNKKDVKALIFEKDQIINSQQKDIEYLRSQNNNLKNEQPIYATSALSQYDNHSRFLNLEQQRLSNNSELEV